MVAYSNIYIDILLKHQHNYSSQLSRPRFLTLACLVVVTGLMYIVNYISPYGYRHCKKAKNAEAFDLFNSLWFCLASMLQQGADNTPRSLSGIKICPMENTANQNAGKPLHVSSRHTVRSYILLLIFYGIGLYSYLFSMVWD